MNSIKRELDMDGVALTAQYCDDMAMAIYCLQGSWGLANSD